MPPYPLLLAGVAWMVIYAIYTVLRKPEKSVGALTDMISSHKTRHRPSDEGVALFFLIFLGVMLLLTVL